MLNKNIAKVPHKNISKYCKRIKTLQNVEKHIPKVLNKKLTKYWIKILQKCEIKTLQNIAKVWNKNIIKWRKKYCKSVK